MGRDDKHDEGGKVDEVENTGSPVIGLVGEEVGDRALGPR